MAVATERIEAGHLWSPPPESWTEGCRGDITAITTLRDYLLNPSKRPRQGDYWEERYYKHARLLPLHTLRGVIDQTKLKFEAINALSILYQRGDHKSDTYRTLDYKRLEELYQCAYQSRENHAQEPALSSSIRAYMEQMLSSPEITGNPITKFTAENWANFSRKEKDLVAPLLAAYYLMKTRSQPKSESWKSLRDQTVTVLNSFEKITTSLMW